MAAPTTAGQPDQQVVAQDEAGWSCTRRRSRATSTRRACRRRRTSSMIASSRTTAMVRKKTFWRNGTLSPPQVGLATGRRHQQREQHVEGVGHGARRRACCGGCARAACGPAAPRPGGARAAPAPARPRRGSGRGNGRGRTATGPAGPSAFRPEVGSVRGSPVSARARAAKRLRPARRSGAARVRARRRKRDPSARSAPPATASTRRPIVAGIVLAVGVEGHHHRIAAARARA